MPETLYVNDALGRIESLLYAQNQTLERIAEALERPQTVVVNGEADAEEIRADLEAYFIRERERRGGAC